jgi:hypothetical protein
MSSNSKSYMVQDAGNGNLEIKEIPNGNVVQIISLPHNAKMLTPPMISGGQVSYTCLLGGTVRRGYVHKVPSGNLISIFSG